MPSIRLHRCALALALFALPLAASARAQVGGKALLARHDGELAAPARFTAEHTPAGVQLHWSTVPNAYEYWIYGVANAAAPDTGMLGNVPAANIATGKDGGFVDRGRKGPVEYRIRAVDVNHKRGPASRVTYAPPPAKIEVPLTKKP